MINVRCETQKVKGRFYLLHFTSHHSHFNMHGVPKTAQLPAQHYFLSKHFLHAAEK